MSHSESSHPQHSPEPMNDAVDKPPVLFLTVLVVVSFVAVLLSGLGAYVFLWKSTALWDKSEVDGTSAVATRMTYEKQQQQILSAYGKMPNGAYHISIDKAMEITVERQGNVFNH